MCEPLKHYEVSDIYHEELEVLLYIAVYNPFWRSNMNQYMMEYPKNIQT